MISDEMIDVLVDALIEDINSFNNKEDQIKEIIDSNPNLISDLEKILKIGNCIFDDTVEIDKFIYDLKIIRGGE